MRADALETVYAEPDAVARALELMEERDLVLILAEDVSAVLAQVRPRGSE